MNIGSIVLGILAFVVLLSVIIIIHGLGHLITAKKFGVYCHEFSIGMGPRLWHHQFKETTLSLRAIPFGGYVMMAGEDDGSEEVEEMKNVPENRRLNGIAAWKQVIIMAAGAFMNIMLAWVILIGINMVQGYVVVDTDPIIYEVQEGSPADTAGLQAGDEIIAQYPSSGETITSSERIILLSDASTLTMPDMSGWTRKDVTAFWRLTGIPISISGSGKVTSQSIEAGQAISAESEISVKLE